MFPPDDTIPPDDIHADAADSRDRDGENSDRGGENSDPGLSDPGDQPDWPLDAGSLEVPFDDPLPSVPRYVGDIPYEMRAEVRYPDDEMIVRKRSWFDYATMYAWNTFEVLPQSIADSDARIADAFAALETLREAHDPGMSAPYENAPREKRLDFIGDIVRDADDRFTPDSDAWMDFLYKRYVAGDDRVSADQSTRLPDPPPHVADVLHESPAVASDSVPDSLDRRAVTTADRVEDVLGKPAAADRVEDARTLAMPTAPARVEDVVGRSLASAVAQVPQALAHEHRDEAGLATHTFHYPNQFVDGEYDLQHRAWKSAACGPVSFMAVQSWAGWPAGTEVTLSQAIDAAIAHGWWDPQLGMHGPAAARDMFQQFGLEIELLGGRGPANDAAIVRAVSDGRPVVVSTAAHYFVLAPNSYDPATKTFDVGTTGTNMSKFGGQVRMGLDAMDAASRRLSGGGYQAALIPVTPS